MTSLEIPDGFNPADTITISYRALGEACADAARAGIDSERVRISEQLTLLYQSVVNADHDAHFQEGVEAALKCVTGGGLIESLIADA